MHDGTINAASDGPGHGSRFTVCLPMCGMAETDLEIVPQAIEQRSGLRVLIIDDNVDFASSLATILEGMKNQVCVAHDGSIGIGLAQKFDPDIALVDIGLPSLNRHDVARALRERSQHDRMLLVAVTGWGQESHRTQATSVGFDAHMVKPLDSPQLPTLFRNNLLTVHS